MLHMTALLRAIPMCFVGPGYVSTANLDGETNLKLKTAPQITQERLTTGALMLGGDGVCDSQVLPPKVSHTVDELPSLK